jgi:hypothetical protein
MAIHYDEDNTTLTIDDAHSIHEFIAGLSSMGQGGHIDKVIFKPEGDVTQEMCDRWMEGMQKVMEAIFDLDAQIHDDMDGCF